MTKLVLLLSIVGSILMFVGIRIPDKQIQKIGVGLLIAALVILFFGNVLKIDLFPG